MRERPFGRGPRARRLAPAALVTAVLGGTFLVTTVPPSRGEVLPPPNVLLVVTDDQRPEGMEAMPKTRAWFEATGTTFTNAFATTPLCCPSRSSIMSGRYAHNHGVQTNTQAKRLDHALTLQHELQLAGYATGISGKFLNRWGYRRPPPYFDRFTVGEGGYVNARFNVEGRQITAPYGPRFVFEQAGRYIDGWEASDDTPWFLLVTPFSPHRPFTPEAKYAGESFPWDGSPATKEADRSDKPPWVRNNNMSEEEGKRERQAQLRTLRTIDDLFESLVARLVSTGELANTILLFMGDNGFHWSEHGLRNKGAPYEASVRIPMLLSGPGLPSGAIDPRITANIDVAPTVYELLGMTPSYTLDGRSLFSTPRDRLLNEQARSKSPRVPEWASLRTSDWVYIETFDKRTTFREFYDLSADPWQLTNLYADGDPTNDPDPGPLHDALMAARSCAGSSCP